MYLALQLLIVMLLAVIFTEDLRHRAVHWFWFPLLGAGLLAARLLSTTTQLEVLKDISINLLFLSVQLLLVTLYFSIKRRQLTNITLDLLGWGDILLLLCLTVYLPPISFVAFYIVSLMLILIGWLIYQVTVSHPAGTLPLAGLQAFLLALVIILSYGYKGLLLTNDHWLLSYLT